MPIGTLIWQSVWQDSNPIVGGGQVWVMVLISILLLQELMDCI